MPFTYNVPHRQFGKDKKQSSICLGLKAGPGKDGIIIDGLLKNTCFFWMVMKKIRKFILVQLCEYID